MSNQEAIDGIKLILDRLSALEIKVNELSQDQPLGEPVPQASASAVNVNTDNDASTDIKVPSQELDAIRDSLSKVTLPPHLKLIDSQAGIKQESKGALKIISKVARTTETSLKQISVIAAREKQEGVFNITETELANLFTLASGQMQFLQSEYAALVVKNTFNDETSRLFRSFENHSSAFNSTSLQNLRIAADLAASSNSVGTARERAFRGRGDRRGFNNYNNWNSRGRGNFRRGFGADWSIGRNPPTTRPEDFHGN